MRAFRRKSLIVKQLAGKMHYEVARKPRWVGGNPVVTPTQLSISDLAPYLAPSETNGETRRRRRGATAERSPSIDGTSSFQNSEKHTHTQHSNSQVQMTQRIKSNKLSRIHLNVLRVMWNMTESSWIFSLVFVCRSLCSHQRAVKSKIRRRRRFF